MSNKIRRIDLYVLSLYLFILIICFCYKNQYIRLHKYYSVI